MHFRSQISTPNDMQRLPQEKGSEFAYIYDAIGKSYETTCEGHCAHVGDIIKKISKDLSPGSKILDMGCGTGYPVASHFAGLGHHVTAVDFSQAMVDAARSNVPSSNVDFIKADISSFIPSSAGDYDVVIASHSLYNFPLGVIRTLIFRFARWVRKDGIFLLVFETAAPGTNRWARHLSGAFMEFKFDGMTYGSADAWRTLVQEAGLAILEEDERLCLPKGVKSALAEGFTPSIGLITKRIVDDPLLGPYPTPKVLPKSWKITRDNMQAWMEIIKRMDWENVRDALGSRENRKPKLLVRSPINLISELTDSAPALHQSDDATFDLVFSFETLQFAGSLEALAKEILGLLPLSGKAVAAFVQAAPDNELINLVNGVAKEIYPQSIRHDGALLRTLQTLLESAGFSVTYEPVEIYLNFEDINKKVMAGTVASYLTAAMFCPENSSDRVKIEEALLEPLSEHFIDRPGKFAYRSVLLLAERS